MASWNEMYRFGSGNELPHWMRNSMVVETSSPQMIYYPQVEDPGQRYGYYSPGYSSGYNYGYDSGYDAGHHHSEYQPEQPTGHQSNHRVWWTPPSGYNPPECTMVLNVPVRSDNDHERVKDELIEIEGVRAIDVDRAKMEVTVSGTFAPKEILNACRKIFKRSNWQPT